MEREEHTVVLEGATLTMGEELFQPSPTTEAIVGCCRDLYVHSLETFVFALVFSGKVGVYQKRTGIPGEQPTPITEGLTKGFEERLKPFGDRADTVITVRGILTDSQQEVAAHIRTINRAYRAHSTEWQQHLIREVWMYSLAEAQKKGIEQRETSLENNLESSEELENLLDPGYVESMLAAVRASIGNLTPVDDVLARFIRKNTVAHIAAHCAYNASLMFRDDLGENRSLMPHPTRQVLVKSSAQSLIQFLVPAVLYDIVVVQGVSRPDILRQRIGDYTTDPSMIELQRKLAEAFAGTDRDREQLSRELGDASREVLAGNPFPGADAGIRRLALMRANYVKGQHQYAEGLQKVFPTLKGQSPAQRDPFRTTNL